MYIILNHKLVQEENASISFCDRGFRYGDGVFETIAVHGGKPWRFDWHLERLKRGLLAIRIAFDCDALGKECSELLKSNAVKDGILRLQVTRGAGGRGYLPDPNAVPTLVIETLPFPILPKQPVHIWLSQIHKVSATALPVRYKLCQGINSILARLEAQDNGCFEALQLSTAEEICEASSANIFWLTENALYTPALSCGVLEGSARAAIMEYSPYPVHEVRTGLSSLENAEAVILCNSVWKALPVAKLLPQNVEWQSETLAQTLNEALAKS